MYIQPSSQWPLYSTNNHISNQPNIKKPTPINPPKIPETLIVAPALWFEVELVVELVVEPVVEPVVVVVAEVDVSIEDDEVDDAEGELEDFGMMLVLEGFDEGGSEVPSVTELLDGDDDITLEWTAGEEGGSLVESASATSEEVVVTAACEGVGVGGGVDTTAVTAAETALAPSVGIGTS